jgi:hypothetical protein
VVVAFNTLVGNAHSIAGEDREFPPRGCVFANNLIQADGGPLVGLGLDAPIDFRWEGNVTWGSAAAGDVPAAGFRRVDPLLFLKDGLHRPPPSSPLVDAAVGSYAEISADMDGQERGAQKDVGADEVSSDPVLRRPLTRADVGPTAP